MNEQQRRNVILAGGAVILLVVGILIGLSLAQKDREPIAGVSGQAGAAEPVIALTEEQKALVRYREFAMRFYVDFILRHDMSAGWDMMEPTMASRWDVAGKEKYIKDFSDRRPNPVPTDLTITTFPDRRDTAATFLFQTGEYDPFVILVQEAEGRLQVVAAWYWKGEKLP